jgi:hypothetical protein
MARRAMTGTSLLRSALASTATLLALSGTARAQEPAPPPAPDPAEPTPPAPAPAAPEPALPPPAASEQPAVPEPPPPPAELAPPPASTNADASAAALHAEAEAAALEAELSAAADSSLPSTPALDLYGFTDFTFTTEIGEHSAIGPPHPTFAVGNLNLYLSSQLSESWRSLIEVRFLYLPHGAVPSAQRFDPSVQRIDTSVTDPADVLRPVRWGGIEIERVWLEYNVSSVLTLRGGQWLTPYGIWNVDHGSPTFIPTIRPYVVGEALFPERQTGLEAYGSAYVDATQVGYHVTLSNGRGPIDAYQDLDDNKGFGGRLFVRNESLLGVLTLGVSGYYGSYTDRPATLTRFDPVEGLVPSDVITLRYDELALAADLKWEWRDWLLQGELISSDVVYDDAVRPADPGLGGGPPGFAADNRRSGAYVLLGYRTPWLQTMPYVLFSTYANDQYSRVNAWIGGLNLRPISQVVLKLEYTNVFFPTDVLPGYQQLTTQVAWSF